VAVPPPGVEEAVEQVEAEVAFSRRDQVALDKAI